LQAWHPLAHIDTEREYFTLAALLGLRFCSVASTSVQQVCPIETLPARLPSDQSAPSIGSGCLAAFKMWRQCSLLQPYIGCTGRCCGRTGDVVARLCDRSPRRSSSRTAPHPTADGHGD
jgi:hypothetical protein